MMVLGEKLNNPYSIANMQAACNVLSATRADGPATLEPNKLYVRFLPKDSADISVLDNLDLELFDYPLDYDIVVEGDYYHDPSIPDGKPTWQYTTVDVDFEFPDIQYEILEKCYIPEYDEEVDELETRSCNDSFMFALETMAICNAGLPDKYQVDVETKALGVGKKPCGYITMDNDLTGDKNESVRGVKVRCHVLVNISNAYTDKDGFYKIGHKYVCKPHYALIYDNKHDFTIWGNYACFNPAQHSLGYHSKTGFDKHIGKNENEWKWAVINNGANDYYEMCESEGIKLPPANLKIWCWKNAKSSSASMIRRINEHYSEVNVSNIIKYLWFDGIDGIDDAILEWCRLVLPDITVGIKGYENSSYSRTYGVIWHELTHASHYTQVGEELWIPYIKHIINSFINLKDTYGTGNENTPGMEICGLGESWAYANEVLSYPKNIQNDMINSFRYKQWFGEYTYSIYKLMKDDILTRNEIYQCLTSDVKSVDALKQKLLIRYPTKNNQINATF